MVRKDDMRCRRRESRMSDLVFTAASVAFFVVSVLYASGCQALKGGRDDA